MPDQLIQRLTETNERIQRLGVLWKDLLAESVPEHGLTLELGCGHGHWLAAYAEKHPKRLCVGIDLITKRVERANRKKSKKELSNLYFLKADAMECLDAMLPEVKVNETIVLFPDPWPKKRHHKRRLINEKFLDLLASKTLSGGKLFYRTDHEEYFIWTTNQVKQHKSWNILPDNPSWPLEHETFFQNLLPNHKSMVAQSVDLQRVMT
jgi:tRNA (guanine-N7-)-methyltransferase